MGDFSIIVVLWKKRPYVNGGIFFNCAKWRPAHYDYMDDFSNPAPHEPVMVAHRLKALREALGMNKADFADAIGLDRSSYTKVENGMKPILPPVAYRIWQLYSVDMNYIYLGQVGGVPSNLSKKLMPALIAHQA